MDWTHNIKRAILILAVITILAGRHVQAHEDKVCAVARMDSKHVWLEQKPCVPDPPQVEEKKLTKPQPALVKKT